MTALLHTFVGGDIGMWRVEHIGSITGSTLTWVPRVAVSESNQTTIPKGTVWLLRGVTSYERYVHKMERSTLLSQQAELGRLEATRAALIPIKKSFA